MSHLFISRASLWAGIPKASECLWTPQAGDDHAKHSSNRPGKHRVEMRTIIGKGKLTDIDHGMKEDSCNQAISGIVIEPNHEDPQPNGQEALLCDPYPLLLLPPPHNMPKRPY